MANESHSHDVWDEIWETMFKMCFKINKTQEKLFERMKIQKEGDENEQKIREEIIETCQSGNKAKEQVINMACSELLKLKKINFQLKMKLLDVEQLCI